MYADVGVHGQFHTLLLKTSFYQNRRENNRHGMKKRLAKQLE
jgi:hypothetical protein